MRLAIVLLLFLFTCDAVGQTHYTGFIDKYPIELQLIPYEWSSIYLYKKNNTPILLDYKLKDSVLILSEANKTGTRGASIIFDPFDENSKTLTGIWKDLISGKTLPVQVSRDYDMTGGKDTAWTNKDVIQAISLKGRYFKTVLSKDSGEYYAAVRGVKILDKKTGILLQQIPVDCQQRGIYSIAVDDYNFDGYEDFSIFEEAYAGANESSLYFLYNPTKKKYFKSNIYGISLVFDPVSKTITESNACCGGRERSVTTYRLVKNEMVEVASHHYVWDEKEQDYVEKKKPVRKKNPINLIH